MLDISLGDAEGFKSVGKEISSMFLSDILFEGYNDRNFEGSVLVDGGSMKVVEEISKVRIVGKEGGKLGGSELVNSLASEVGSGIGSSYGM